MDYLANYRPNTLPGVSKEMKRSHSIVTPFVNWDPNSEQLLKTTFGCTISKQPFYII